MKIAVIGTGYVGLVTGTCLAQAGHAVQCVDIDPDKVARMQAGEVPIYEPGLSELYHAALSSGRLQVTTDLTEGVNGAEAIFLALPTPPGADGSADLSAVLSVASELGPLLRQYTVIIDKSTVPVGTGQQVYQRIAAGTDVDFDVVSNPEFLREGLAVQDFMHPDRIVIGVESEPGRRVMEQLYKSFVTTPEQLVFMDIRSAEMTKYAANSFLAMKVSFMNEMANLCELLDANVDSVRLGIGPDKRIGTHFLFGGIGYGGSCFPKDVQALHYTAENSGYDFMLLESIIRVNTAQKKRLLDKLAIYYDHTISGKHFAVWGLAFKPDTDDIREAPSLTMIEELLSAGATITAYDPQAMPNVKKQLGSKPGLQYADSPLAAAQEADALLIVTEWDEFRTIDFSALKAAMKTPTIFDGRNLYDLQAMSETGFYYSSIGRPLVDASVHTVKIQ